MSSATTTSSGVDPAVAIAAYICGAVGLILICGVVVCILRRIRWRKARKYIKTQRNRSTGMGTGLQNPPEAISNPWSYRAVKAGIKNNIRESEAEVQAAKIRQQKDMQGVGGHTPAYDLTNGSVTPSEAGSSRATTPGPISLGKISKKMHGDRALRIQHAHTIKHERLRKRIEYRRQKRETRQRKKEVKKLIIQMVNGEELPAILDDQSSISTQPERTEVGPLRRESLSEIPSMSLVIERSPRHVPSKRLQQSVSASRLAPPQSLHTWDEESSSRRGKLPRKSGSTSNLREVSEVTVHHVTEGPHGYHNEALEDLEDTTTEL